MVVKALVRLTTPEPAEAVQARIRQHCRTHLEPFKIPAVIEITDEKQYSERFKKIRVTP